MDYQLCLLFFIIALVYSTAGFGGGSSYMAIMALFGINMYLMKSTALLCNIVVVTGGVITFYKQGFLPLKKALWISVASVPLAFLGSYIPLKEHTFFWILGTSLIISALLMFYRLLPLYNEQKVQTETPSVYKFSAAGGFIGGLSGMTGIGGGIFLSPLLKLAHFDTAKNIAGLSSFFILVNSIAGILGQLSRKQVHFDVLFTVPLMICVIVGGQIGTRLSAKKFSEKWVTIATALLVCYAGIRLLMNANA
ncbi:sulfite exporter TauE/SafE family protein [Solitalea sp. MAHUQ-68]|uniref:Probable membrane transporter protein n=1 Tax=Solitalea agri TaxID=2953739 RepID=A0A9X2F880_9SPHI|nr:sulfite exporter TauE/SafE family protein [Solitalea agri]MCO4292378.1 sulfite exporter TauE/SafE family protein [Solitalea agri]